MCSSTAYYFWIVASLCSTPGRFRLSALRSALCDESCQPCVADWLLPLGDPARQWQSVDEVDPEHEKLALGHAARRALRIERLVCIRTRTVPASTIRTRSIGRCESVGRRPKQNQTTCSHSGTLCAARLRCWLEPSPPPTLRLGGHHST